MAIGVARERPAVRWGDLRAARAIIFLVALIVTVLVGIGYFVAYPIYTKWQAGLADAERRAQLTQINAEEAGLAGTFEQLKSEAISTALSLWEDDNTLPVLFAVAFVDAQRGWAVGEGGLILATTDGGATWGEQQAFPRPPAPTAETNWFGAALQRADTPQDLQRAVSLSEREIVDTEYLNRLSDLLGESTTLAQRRVDLPETTLTLEDQAVEAARDAVKKASDEDELKRALNLFDAALRQKAYAQTWWQRLDEQIPLSVLLLFLLATFGSLYRYNTRIAGFYHARADALELMALENPPDMERFEVLAGTLAADRVEFKAAKTLADMATEITKELVAKLNLKPGP